MGSKWYKTWFNSAHYLELYKHRDTRDAKKIVALVNKHIKLPKGSKVLDLACGNGRHSFLFASKGYKVTGIDLSNYLITEARKKLNSDYKRYRQNLSFEIRDMRSIGHKKEFDLVVNLFSSFGYFEKDSENEKVIKGVSGSLGKGGYFFFDFLNSNHLKNSIVPFDVSKLDKNVVIQIRAIKNNFVKKTIILASNNPGKKYPQISNFFEKIRLYSLKDLRSMFKKQGLSIIKVFGDYSGKSFNSSNSERLIILAKKR